MKKKHSRTSSETRSKNWKKKQVKNLNSLSRNSEIGKPEINCEVLTNVKRKTRFNALKVKQIRNP